jgi:hypothetical protein
MKMKPKPGGRKDKLLLEIAQVYKYNHLKLTKKKYEKATYSFRLKESFFRILHN